MKDIKLPEKCKLCKHIGAYISGPFARNPHYCCELIWQIKNEDYRVNPETIDERCPLKNKKLMEAFNEILNS